MSQHSCDAQEGICPPSNASHCLYSSEAADAAALVRLLPLSGSGCCLLEGMTGLVTVSLRDRRQMGCSAV